jgi:hypothetical protein
MKSLAILAALALTNGCATCDRHPTMCGVAGALVIGGIAAACVSHHKSPAFTPTPQSSPGGNLL